MEEKETPFDAVYRDDGPVSGIGELPLSDGVGGAYATCHRRVVDVSTCPLSCLS